MQSSAGLPSRLTTKLRSALVILCDGPIGWQPWVTREIRPTSGPKATPDKPPVNTPSAMCSVRLRAGRIHPTARHAPRSGFELASGSGPGPHAHRRGRHEPAQMKRKTYRYPVPKSKVDTCPRGVSRYGVSRGGILFVRIVDFRRTQRRSAVL